MNATSSFMLGTRARTASISSRPQSIIFSPASMITRFSKVVTAGFGAGPGKSKRHGLPRAAVSSAASTNSSTTSGLVVELNPTRPFRTSRSPYPRLCRLSCEWNSFARNSTTVRFTSAPNTSAFAPRACASERISSST
jgi:hypothetical protein